jgi:hypothetical protein
MNALCLEPPNNRHWAVVLVRKTCGGLVARAHFVEGVGGDGEVELEVILLRVIGKRDGFPIEDC